jgi:hypothetical protein
MEKEQFVESENQSNALAAANSTQWEFSILSSKLELDPFLGSIFLFIKEKCSVKLSLNIYILVTKKY